MKKLWIGCLFVTANCIAQVGPLSDAPPGEGATVPEPSMFWPILVIAIAAIGYRYYKLKKATNPQS